MFKFTLSRNWTTWKHVDYVEDCGTHTVFELLKRVNHNTGLTQYKKVFISSPVFNLAQTLNSKQADKL